MLILLTVLIGIVCSVLGTIVLINAPKKRANILFFISAQLAAIWITVNTFFPHVDDEMALTLGRVSFVSALLLVYFMWRFIVEFNKTGNEDIRIIYYLTSFLILPAFCALSLTKYVTAGIVRQDDIPSIDYGSLYPFYTIVLSLHIFLSIFSLIRKQESLTGQDKLQIKYLFIGFSLTAAFALTFNLLIPLLTGSSYFSRYGPISTIFFLTATTFAIIKFRLFGVKYLSGSLLNLLLISLIPYISFYLVLFIQTEIWGGIYTTGAFISGLIVAIAFTLLFLFSRQKLSNYFLTKVIYNGNDPKSVGDKFIKTISTELDLEKISLNTYSLFSNYFGITQFGIVLLNKTNQTILFEKVLGVDINNVTATIFDYLDYVEEKGHHPTILKREMRMLGQTDPKINQLYKFMEQNGIEIFFPINNNVKLNGLIFLGAKSNKEAYTIEDIQFLRTIMLNTAVALSRALLYFEVENFNNTLKSKVDAATAQIRSQKDALSETLRKERDMLDILAHELRTPLTIGKNAIKVIKGKSNTGMVPKEELDKYVELAEDNLDREAKLLETMLTTTKIEHGEINLSFQKVDINDVISRSMKTFSKKAKEKNLQIIFTPSENYYAYADPSRMKEILDNLIDNAIKYTEKGSITIQSAKSDPFISISVIDTGAGIPAEEIPKLGNKFYRVNTYVKNSTETGYTSVRAGGTGLGLFVVYNLVKAMNGKVNVNSEVGKGSNFTVSIPAYTDQKVDEAESKGEKLYERFERMKQEKNKGTKAMPTEAVS